eukprot:6159071-Prymnesium_polylepis.1
MAQLTAVRHKVVVFQNKLPKYRKLYMYQRKLKEKGGDVFKTERSLFSLCTHELEDCVMEKIREYIWSQGVEIFAQIHDGLITSESSDDLLRGAENYTAEFGWHIRLVEKSLYGLQDNTIPELTPLY